MNVYGHQFDGAISLGTLPLAAGMVVASAKASAAINPVCDFQLTTYARAFTSFVSRQILSIYNERGAACVGYAKGAACDP